MNDNKSVCALATVLFFVTAVASAQTVVAGSGQDKTTDVAAKVDAAQASETESAIPPAQDAQAAAEGDEVFDHPLQVGDATSNLFAWQRGGEIASSTPRPIAGSVASRSYERYLKSFEHPIPEQFNSSVKSTSAGSGLSSAR